MYKKCIKCNLEFNIEKFYKHKQMADGHLNKCKECCKNDVQKNYEVKKEYYQEYDKKRAKLSHRVEVRKQYMQTEAGKKSHFKAVKKFRENNKEKRIAHSLINNKLRYNKIEKPAICTICNKKSEIIHGHHNDYTKPLEVVWCCPQCHKDIHNSL